MTQTSFDYSQHFDVLIIAGHMKLDKIPVWSHIYANDTYVLLYQCEERWFNYEMRNFKDNVIPLLGNDYYRFLVDDDINDSITPLADAYIMARLSRQKSDNFIMNQAAAFAASSNMAGKYASAGGMFPMAEWQRA